MNKHKEHLLKRGWNQRQASKKLKVCYTYLSEILNGRRESKRLGKAILDLPMRKGTK